MSLNKFTVKKPNLLLIDLQNLVFRTLATAVKEDPLDKSFILFKSMMVERVIDAIDLFKADRVIVAMDDKNYWRKDIYADYKGHRSGARKKSKIDFDAFWPVWEDFLPKFQNAFGFLYYLKVDRCEADDIIAVLTKSKLEGYNVTCLSNDSDLKQLYKYKNYKQYNPLKREYYKPINSKKDLMLKILTGDSGDNIPNVAYRCGPVKAQSFLDEGLDKVFKKEPNIEKNFKRNKQLIDLDLIPPKYFREISDIYESYVINTYNGRKMFDFLTDHRLKGIIENFERFSKRLMVLD